MANKRKVQQLPSIMIEDFDSREVRFAYTSFPVNLSPPGDDNCTVIEPHVDAYVTPLSLCHHVSTPVAPVPFPDKSIIVDDGPRYLEYETSFTSIDIGTFNTSKVASDCSMNTTTSNAGCFDIRSGLMRVTRSITTGLGSGFVQAPVGDFYLDIPATPTAPHKAEVFRKKFDVRYAVGLFFICLAFAGIVALCVTIYIEFVAKPSWSASTTQEVASICDFIVNVCDSNNTSVTSHLVNHTVTLTNSGRTEAQFSENFLSKLPK